MIEKPRHNISKELSRRKRLLLSGAAAVLVLGAGVGVTLFKTDVFHPHSGDDIITTNPKNITSGEDLLQGNWQYMPGTSKDKNGLHIQPADFRIVEQDGSGGQPNPAVNNLGTQLQVGGDFSVEANMSGVGNEAAVSLYGTPPVIADEFRLDQNTIRMNVNGANLTVQTWDTGQHRNPATSTTYPITASDHHKLKLERDGDKLDISVDGQQVVELEKGNIFNTGRVIFGADAGQNPTNQPWTLASLIARSINGGKVTAIDASTIQAPEIKDSLQTLASKKRPGFIVGSAMAAGPMTDAEYVSQMRNFGGMTLENAGKWQFTEPQPGMFTFQEADGMVKVAQNNGIDTIVGHTPVFSEAMPDWMRNMPTGTPEQKAKVQEAMVNHITQMATHFKGKIKMYDIPNEVWDDDGNLRDNVFLRAMGPDYVKIAIDALHQADPNAQAWLNMYGAETPGDIQDAMYNFISGLKHQGVNVYGVALQAHVYEEGDEIDKSELKATITRFASLGLKVRISENDVTSTLGTKKQATQYRDIFAACFESPSCISYSVWGFADKYNYWKDDDGTVYQGQDLLFDKDMRATLGLQAIQEYLRK